MLINKLIIFLLTWSNIQKRLLIAFLDVFIVVFCLWISLSVDVQRLLVPNKLDIFIIFYSVCLALPIFSYFDLYRSAIRYIGFREIWGITKATILLAALGLLINLLFFDGSKSFLFFYNFWILLLLSICSSRLFASWILTEKSLSSNVIIYGAGAGGIQLASALRFSRELKPIAYIDENETIQGNFLNGIKVFKPSKLPALIKEKEVEEVLIAIPSAKKFELNRIVSSIGDLSIKVRVLPGVEELAQGKISVSDLKILDITDLLGREATVPHQELLIKNIRDKNVMVSGAGGSIGAELCRQISKIGPKKLVLFEISEAALYSIDKELENYGLQVEICPILGNVNDKGRLQEVCRSFSIQTIYHAAAYKQVPMVEMNTIQSLENNIVGTLNCALVAMEYKVETFVLISTDKAVRPTNVMGASKRFSELIIQSLSQRNEKNQNTKFTIVRFGNVLGSSSSVVPLFREQIKKGGPVTVTDPEIVRYFMSIPEAAELVIQAGSLGVGGEVFVLDMGNPIKIYDLAKKMIRLSGLEVFDMETKEGDIEIEFSGLREGEKLFEELIIGDEVSKTQHDRILKADEESLEWEEVETFLSKFKEAFKTRNERQAHDLLINSVSVFKPYSGLNDLIYKSNKNRNIR